MEITLVTTEVSVCLRGPRLARYAFGPLLFDKFKSDGIIPFTKLDNEVGTSNLTDAVEITFALSLGLKVF